MTTQYLEDVETLAPPVPDTAEPGDHERLSHYVEKHKLTQAMIEGTPCTALCGKVWVPNRDGTKFPVCPECAEILKAMPEGD